MNQPPVGDRHPAGRHRAQASGAAVPMPIGFIGLGRMGGAIARRLQAAGAVLHVHDPSPTAAAALAANGAVVAASALAVADACELVFASLPRPQVSLQVAAEVARGRALRTYVETSTVGDACLRQIAAALAAAGVQTVDAPVSGGMAAAQAGSLSVMVAGAAEALAQARPWLAVLGPVAEFGPRPGQAQTMKLINNLVAATNLAATCEALVFGARAGLDAAAMVRALDAGSGHSRATATLLPEHVLTGRFAFGAPLGMLLKDLELALAEAGDLQMPLRIGQQAVALWRDCAAVRGDDDDLTNLMRMLEQRAGVRVGDRPAD